MDILYDHLNEIQGHDQRLRKMVNLPPIPSDIRKMGTGGGINKDQSSNLNYLMPIENFDLEEYTKKIMYARRWANLEDLSYTEILDKADNNPNKYKAIPAMIPIQKHSCEFTSGYGKRRDPLTGKRKRHFDIFSLNVRYINCAFRHGASGQ